MVMRHKMHATNVLRDAVRSCLLVFPHAVQRSCVERGSQDANLSKPGKKYGQRIEDLFLWKPADQSFTFPVADLSSFLVDFVCVCLCAIVIKIVK